MKIIQVTAEYNYENVLTAPDENNIPELAEWHVYGNEQQGRFLTVYPNRTYANTSIDPTQRVFYGAGLSEDITNNIFKRQLGNKAYELKDHLGNVRETFSDIKIPTAPYTTPFEVDLLSKAEYFPYGMQIEELGWNAVGASARYGYNGKEKDNEIKGESNSLDFGARIYDPRGARFLSQDPLKSQFAFQSPFIYAGDSPINSIDKNGEYKLTVNYNEFEKGKFTILKIVKDNSPKYNSLMLGQIQLFKDIPFADVFPLIPNTVEYVKWDGNGNKISSSGELPLKNIGSTRYPGPFNPKDLSQNNPDFRFPPINSLDLAGMEHDKVYQDNDAHGANGAFFNRNKAVIEADIKLVSASLEVINMFLTGQTDPVSHQAVDFEQARAATGVAILFTGLVAQKMLINTHLLEGKDILKQIEVLKQKIESLPSDLKSAAQGPLNQMSNELTPNP